MARKASHHLSRTSSPNQFGSAKGLSGSRRVVPKICSHAAGQSPLGQRSQSPRLQHLSTVYSEVSSRPFAVHHMPPAVLSEAANSASSGYLRLGKSQVSHAARLRSHCAATPLALQRKVGRRAISVEESPMGS
ncbi:unnamed protein product [Polarella glacialis]|uniref:Uncharacterized protein n=1 Tax=Polarella glacialis TaxID=89957 RepID=A0A813KLQ8_POLGL|nr:unnamed protein product [Polarella glacialis]CAE8735027.1 unnamed protein product [Polarella glacialis]